MFQLINITIHKHPVLGYVSLNFDKTDGAPVTENGIMTSVIIGKNGVGKSYLLRAIADIFRTLDCLVNGGDDVKMPEIFYRFGVTYKLGDHIYSVSDIHNGIEPRGRNQVHPYYFKIDNRNALRREMRLPQRVIASSMTVADKFPTPSMGIYRYRGIRNEKSPSTTGTRTIVRKAVEGIMDSLAHKHTTREELALILNELGFEARLEIRYRFRYRNVFLREDMNRELLEDIYTNWRNYFQGRSGEVWGTKYYMSLRNNPEKIEQVCEYLRRAASRYGHFEGNNVIYDVFNVNSPIVYDSDVIKILSNLDILSFPEFIVYKRNQNEGYEFVESSSGETQQLCQFISIMSVIEDNSLIIIDEPENSSHPNWQMSYIQWLQRIFHRYNNCHFVIATHSHFLLTDMRPEWSRIVALDKKGDELLDIAEGVNTFCWSVDDILYRVFHVRNTRNYVFENKMCELYEYIENSTIKTKKARALMEELKTYLLNADDPLHKLLILAQNAQSE